MFVPVMFRYLELKFVTVLCVPFHYKASEIAPPLKWQNLIWWDCCRSGVPQAVVQRCNITLVVTDSTGGYLPSKREPGSPLWLFLFSIFPSHFASYFSSFVRV